MRIRKGFFLLLLCFSASLPLVSPHAETVDRIVAVVGRDVITLYDLDRAMVPYLDSIRKTQERDAKFKAVRSEVINRLVDDLLLKQAMAEAKIEVTNDDIAHAVRNVLNQNHITIEVLKAELASKGISFESYKEELRLQIQRLKFINREIGSKVSISEQDMRDYYQGHMAEFGVHQSVHIAQIVLPFDETTTAAKIAELKAKASQIVSEARGGRPFSELARLHSKGPNAEGGGDLGIVSPSLLLPEIASAIEKMRVGEISQPIISTAGIHIIKLIDRARATGADFEGLKDAVYNKMFDVRMSEELSRYLDEMRKKTYVEIRD